MYILMIADREKLYLQTLDSFFKVINFSLNQYHPRIDILFKLKILWLTLDI